MTSSRAAPGGPSRCLAASTRRKFFCSLAAAVALLALLAQAADVTGKTTTTTTTTTNTSTTNSGTNQTAAARQQAGGTKTGSPASSPRILTVGQKSNTEAKSTGTKTAVQQQQTLDPQSSDLSSMYVQIPIAEPVENGASPSADAQQQVDASDASAADANSSDSSAMATTWTGPWPKKFQIGYIKQSDLHQVLIESLKNDPFLGQKQQQQAAVATSGKTAAAPSPAVKSTATTQAPAQAVKSVPGGGQAPAVAAPPSDASSLMQSVGYPQLKAVQQHSSMAMQHSPAIPQQQPQANYWPASMSAAPPPSSFGRLASPQVLPRPSGNVHKGNVYQPAAMMHSGHHHHHHQLGNNNQHGGHLRTQQHFGGMMGGGNFRQHPHSNQMHHNFQQGPHMHHGQAGNRPGQGFNNNGPTPRLPAYLQQAPPKMLPMGQGAGFNMPQQQQFQFAGLPSFKNQPIYTMNNFPQQQQQQNVDVVDQMQLIQMANGARQQAGGKPKSSDPYHSSWRPVQSSDSDSQKQHMDEFGGPDGFDDGFGMGGENSNGPSSSSSSSGGSDSNMNRHPVLNSYLGGSSGASDSPSSKASPAKMLKQQQQQQAAGTKSGRSGTKSVDSARAGTRGDQEQVQQRQEGATKSGTERRALGASGTNSTTSGNNATTTTTTSTTPSPDEQSTTPASGNATTLPTTGSGAAVTTTTQATTSFTTEASGATGTNQTQQTDSTPETTTDPESEVIESGTTEPSEQEEATTTESSASASGSRSSSTSQPSSSSTESSSSSSGEQEVATQQTTGPSTGTFPSAPTDSTSEPSSSTTGSSSSTPSPSPSGTTQVSTREETTPTTVGLAQTTTTESSGGSTSTSTSGGEAKGAPSSSSSSTSEIEGSNSSTTSASSSTDSSSSSPRTDASMSDEALMAAAQRASDVTKSRARGNQAAAGSAKGQSQSQSAAKRARSSERLQQQQQQQVGSTSSPALTSTPAAAGRKSATGNKLITRKPSPSASQRAAKQISGGGGGVKGAPSPPVLITNRQEQKSGSLTRAQEAGAPLAQQQKSSSALGKKKSNSAKARKAAGGSTSNKFTRMAAASPQKSERLQQATQVVSMSPAQAQSAAQTLASLLLSRCLSSSNCAHLLDVCSTKQAAVPFGNSQPGGDSSALANTSALNGGLNSTSISAAWSMPVGLTSTNLMSLMQALQADRALSLFPAWKDAIENVVDQESQAGYTLIMPSNEAIERMPIAQVDSLLANGEQMSQLIENHILDSAETIDLPTSSSPFTSANLFAGPAPTTPTGNQNGRGSSSSGARRTRYIKSKGLQINQHRDRMVTINGKRVVYANQQAPGGRIHVIDGLLDWPAPSFALAAGGNSFLGLPTGGGSGAALTSGNRLLDIMDTLKQCDKFDGFVTLAEGTGLTQILKQDEPLTVFVPSNEALRKIPDEELEVIKNNSTALREFIMYHIVNGSYFSQDLRDGQQLPSILDMRPIQVGVRVDGCSRRLVEANTSPMRRPDIVAKNGVIHILDWYLTTRDNDWCDPIGAMRSAMPTNSNNRVAAAAAESGSPASERLQQVASEPEPSSVSVVSSSSSSSTSSSSPSLQGSYPNGGYATRMSASTNLPPNHKMGAITPSVITITPAESQSGLLVKPTKLSSVIESASSNEQQTNSVYVSAVPMNELAGSSLHSH